MAESTLALGYVEYMNKLTRVLGMGNGIDYTTMDAQEQAILDGYVQDGYRQALRAHDWSFLEPVRDLVLWAAIASSSGYLVESETYIPDDNETVVEADTALFYYSMQGKNVTFTSGDSSFSYPIKRMLPITGDGPYTLAVFDGNRTGHVGWTISMATDGSHRMPGDFAGVIGKIAFPQDDGRYMLMDELNDIEIRRLLQYTTSASRPTKFSQRATEEIFDGTRGQRFDLVVWPVPDTAYTVSYKSRINPNKMSLTNPYPYGGAKHDEMYLHSILSMAELLEEDVVAIHTAKYERALQDSINLDNKFGGPETLGQNLDRSDEVYGHLVDRRSHNYGVTYNGVQY